MITATTSPVRKQRPFPWLCPNCKRDTVVPVTVPYTARIKHDGTVHEVQLKALTLPRCSACGETLITDEADEQLNRTLCRQLGLLFPEQVLANRTARGLSQLELASKIGVAKESICRWETGALIQSRAMDTLLRLYFGLAEVRSALADQAQCLELGTRV